MAFKSTRKKTGTNSYETTTHNRKTGEVRRTSTVKLPGVTRSTSSSSRKPGVRITTTRKSAGYVDRQSYSTVKKHRSKKTKSTKKSSSKGFFFLIFILFIVWLIA